MPTVDCAIKLPVVRRARSASGLSCSSLDGAASHLFESQLGLNARIEEWNTGLPHQTSQRPIPRRLPRERAIA